MINGLNIYIYSVQVSFQMPMGIDAFNPDNNLMRYEVLSSFPFYRYGNWGIAKFSNLLEITYKSVVAPGFKPGEKKFGITVHI